MLGEWSSTWADFCAFPRRHLAIFGETLGCYSWWGRCYWFLVDRGQGRWWMLWNTGQPPATKNDLAQNVGNAKAGEACAQRYLQYGGWVREIRAEWGVMSKGANACARTMLLLSERRGKLPSFCPPECRGDVSGSGHHPQQGRTIVVPLCPFSPRFWLGTPEEWVAEAVILHKQTQSLNGNLKLLITSILAYYEQGSSI